MKTKFLNILFVLSLTAIPIKSFADETPNLMTGVTKLACEATLCLSSGVQPSPCGPSLDHYFGIEVFKKGYLDWGATVAARLNFLNMCPSASAPGMPERVDAISKGAGKCDADYLNRTYAATTYKYRIRGYTWGGDAGREPIYEVHPIKTVSLNKLPSYCVAYNNHEWTYELSIQYVGEILKGGYWVANRDFDAAQSKWNAEQNSSANKGWSYAMFDPRNRNASSSNNGY